jgi:hypothetical protein
LLKNSRPVLRYPKPLCITKTAAERGRQGRETA